MKAGFYTSTSSAFKCLITIAVLLCFVPRTQAQYIPIDSGFAEILMANSDLSGCINNYQMDTNCAKSATFIHLQIQPVVGLYSAKCRSLNGLQYIGKNLMGMPVGSRMLTIWNFDSLFSIQAIPSIYDYINIGYIRNLSVLGNIGDSATRVEINPNSQWPISLPAWPTYVSRLIISNCNITSIPALPSTLEYFAVTFCPQLTGLPALNTGLEELHLMHNGLTSLPSLPSSLRIFWCSTLPITSLPALNSGLTHLVAEYCNLTSLPALPVTLTSMRVGKNGLTALPTLPPALQHLDCADNWLTTLPLLPATLTSLDCYRNQLVSLPALEHTQLWGVNCNVNFLTELPTLPNTLRSFGAGYNLLTTLPNFPPLLESIWLDSNQITSLPPFNNVVRQLNVTRNKLSTLPELPDSLRELQIAYNPIGCLPSLPNKLVTLDVENTLVNCLPNIPPGLQTLLPVCNDSIRCPYLGISGRVYVDRNSNCVYDSTDMPLKSRQLKLDGNDLTITDANGFYSALSDSGAHTITLTNVTNLYGYNCGDSVLQVTFTGDDPIDTLDFPLAITSYCTNLVVDVAAPFIRNTILNYHQVYITNTGTDTAYNAYVEVKFDPELIPLDCTLPYTTLPNNTIRVDLGDVAPYDEINFTITDSVSIAAPVGQTACVKANVYPKGNCIPIPAQWDSSHITVQSMWLPGDTVITFKAKNIGKPMSDSTEFRIYEEELLMLKGRLKLIGLDSFIVTVPANGHTYRMEADQHPFHPGFSKPRDFMELAGTPPYVLHHIITVPQDDDDEWVEIDCHEIVASYDPNAKTVYPAGVGANHYITNDDRLEYILQFQNTGNDTAFNVRLIDTLDTQHLDITSFASGVSSHSYEVQMRGSNIVEWIFANIKLVDSTTNEPASHGFVKFKIKQVAGNAPGTLINNYVDIYFDYNTPVRTNTAFVTIEEKENIFPVSVIAIRPETGYNVHVMPNPFAETANFEIATENTNDEQYTFELFDMLGRNLISKQVSNRFSLNRNDIDAGVYMFRLTTKGKLIGTGKIVAR